MPEPVVVFQKQKAELTGSDRDFALSCVSEFLNEPLHAYEADFLTTSGCIVVSRSQGIVLSFFFKNSNIFLDQLGKILIDYAQSTKHAGDIMRKYSYLESSSKEKIKMLVFVPAYEENWLDLSSLIRIPIQVVPFMTVVSRSRQAIVLESEKKIEMGEASPRDMTPRKKKLDEDPKPSMNNSYVSKKPILVSESYFQRAKLTSEEIRALLDFELLLEDIKEDAPRISV